MSRTCEDLGRPDEDGPGQGHGGINYKVEIGGTADGPVVAGSYNLVVDARHGSTVTVGVERERPAPVRRDRISVLPRRTREPLGREAEATTLAAAITEGGLVQLCGPAGIGKSTLLRHLARTAKSGPDGVVFVSATHKQVADLAQEVFEACYRTRGYAPSRTDLRGMLTGLRITVYVDDVDLTIDQLRELTDLVPDATFVLAGRDSTPLDDGAVHHLDGLGRDVATGLLTRALGRPLHDAERVTAGDLWQVSGGNPLLLLRAAGLAGSGRSALPVPGAVGDLLPRLLEQLGKPATSTLDLLAALEDAELATGHIGGLTGEPDPAALCDRLADLGLVTPGEHGYRCAPGVAAAVRRRAGAAVPVETLCRYFTRWVGDPATTPAQVADHSRAIEKVAGLAADAGLPELTVALSRAASPKLAHSLRFDAWGRTLGRGWTGARRAGDREAEAYFTHEEGVRCLVTGRRVVTAAALLTQAVVLWHVLGDHQGTTAASDAHRFLPQDLRPPDRIDPLEQAVPGEDGTSDVVADHMADLEHVIPEPPSPTTCDSVGSTHSGTDTADFGVAPDPGPTQALGNPTTAPGGGDFGATADAAGSVLPGSAATTGGTAAAGATTAVAAQGASLLTTLLVALAFVGAIAVIAYDKADGIWTAGSPPTGGAGSPPTAGAGGTGVAGTWEIDQNEFTIEESGSGAYVFLTTCEDSVRLTGSDTRASGRMPAYDIEDPDCGTPVGYVLVTVTVGADGDTARWTETVESGQEDRMTCFSCGTRTMTRIG